MTQRQIQRLVDDLKLHQNNLDVYGMLATEDQYKLLVQNVNNAMDAVKHARKLGIDCVSRRKWNNDFSYVYVPKNWCAVEVLRTIEDSLRSFKIPANRWSYLFGCYIPLTHKVMVPTYKLDLFWPIFIEHKKKKKKEYENLYQNFDEILEKNKS